LSGSMDIHFFEVFEEEEEALRACLPPEVHASFHRETVQESGRDRSPGGIVSIRTQSVIPSDWVHDIDAILTRSTGYDHVLAFLDETGVDIPSGYLPSYCSRAVAEHALMLWLALLRRLRLQTEHFGKFCRDGLTGGECRGRRLAVVGVGSIGVEVCAIGEALGMEVVGVDIVRRHAGVTYAGAEEAIAGSDVVVCAMNLTRSNRGYFTYGLLKKAKRKAIFVNVARGEFVDPADLLRLLEEGHLGGVGLDVYPGEALLAGALRAGTPSGDASVEAVVRLCSRPDVICTPHNAFNTVESVARKAEQSVRQALHFIAHKTFIWNVPR